MRLWLLRHGPTGRAGAFGRTDVPARLDDPKRLAAVSAMLPDAPLRPSTRLRARMTAEAVAQARAVLPGDPALDEIDFGLWEGLGFDDISARWPEESRAFWDGHGPAPQGESFAQVMARVGAAMTRLADLEQPDVIVAAHMGAIMAALGVACDLTPKQAMRFRVGHLSLTRLDYAPQTRGWSVAFVNR